MWNPASPTRNALALLMAAAVAFFGSAVLLKAGRGFPLLTGGQVAAARPGMPLLAIVILLGVCGVLLVAMAGKELLDQHRRGPSAR
jgi:NAD/NADP transhydrogenase alpha subunit